MITIKLLILNLHIIVQALRKLFHLEGAKLFKKGQFQGRLKQLNLKQNPG